MFVVLDGTLHTSVLGFLLVRKGTTSKATLIMYNIELADLQLQKFNPLKLSSQQEPGDTQAALVVELRVLHLAVTRMSIDIQYFQFFSHIYSNYIEVSRKVKFQIIVSKWLKSLSLK